MSLLITVASVSMPAISQVCKFAEKSKEAGDFVYKIHYLGKDNLNSNDLENDIKNADLLLIDLMGLPKSVSSKITEWAKACKGQRLSLGGMAPSLSRLGGYDEVLFNINKTDEEELYLIRECWKRAEYRDIAYIFTSVLKNYLDQEYLPDVTCSIPRNGAYIMDPITLEEFNSAEEFFQGRRRNLSRSCIVITYSGNSYPTRTIETVRMLFEKMSEFADVLPIAMSSYDARHIPMMKSLIGDPDAIVNVLPFRFMAGPMGGDAVSAMELLREIDVPHLSPFFLTKTSRDEWLSNKSGTNPMEFMLNIFLPELDGALCTIPIGFNDETYQIDAYGISVTEIVPLEDRVNRIVGKVRNYINLRNKLNSDKKVAILSYNYPPGEGNLFGGSFLDSLSSLSSILNMLSSEGYVTKEMSSDEILDYFLRNGILNDGQWMPPSDEMLTHDNYQTHLNNVSRVWGRPPGDIMVKNGKYMIPGIINGNVFIGLQPARTSDSRNNSSSYHDSELPPHHQYMAMYDWIRNVFKADAIIHLGTHGTLEFLPGKESALSSDCYPDLLIDDSVHIYIYYAGNPSEAMIAKRRAHACLLSYMPPPFMKSDIYGDLLDLEEAIAEYRESINIDSGRGQSLLKIIESKALSMRLPTDITELEDELLSIRESLIPRGLHTFGKAFEREEAEHYAIQSMQFPHENIVPLEKLIDPIIHDIEEIYHNYYRESYISEHLQNDDIANTLDFMKNLVIRSSNTDELDNLKRALEGKFIDVKPGGDILKDPEILPTGYNIVQFNPDRIPTLAAFERGRQAAEDAIRQYRKNTGEYPHGAALILWGLETSRTRGLTIGQICSYLGLRMIRTSGDFLSRFEIIPIEELGRPRIDVTVSMCGFFRDMFPNLVNGLCELFSFISSLDESVNDNYCKEATRRNREFLKSMGCVDDEVDDLSECRLFGPARGEYGTSMTNLVNNSSWTSEEELGNSFTDSLRYAYTRSLQGHDSQGLLRFNHQNVQVISQVRDSADRELIDLDHYYEFLGGLSKSVEMANNGKKSSVFVIDASRAVVRTQDVRRSIERGVRTRLLNPKWIDGLLDVKYHGTQQINERFENVLGLASTVGGVDSGVFSDMLDCYVRDPDVRRRVSENNNWAYMAMIDRLFEANSRGYWDATEEEMDLLKNAYLESEELAESETDILPK